MDRQLKSTRNNIIGRFTFDQMVVGVIFFAAFASLLDLSMDYGVFDGTLIGVAFVLAALVLLWLYYTFFMKESTLYNSIAMVRYGFDYAIGNTKLRKHTCTASNLKTKIPISEVHENGMIEFPEKQFGVLLTLYSPTVTDAEHPLFILRIIDALNSIPEDIMVKIFKFSHVDTMTPLLDQIKDAINDPNTTKEMKDHLYPSYDLVSGIPGRIVWDGYFFIAVGKHPNAKKAKIKSNIDVEVVMDGLRHANFIPYLINEEHKVMLAYRQMLSMKRVF